MAITASQRLIAVVEIIAFAAIAIISKRLVDPLLWRYAGPITLIGLLILLTGYLKFRGRSWREMGLKSLSGLRPKLLLIPQTLLTFGAFALAVTAVLLGGEALGLEFMLEIPEGVEDRWGDIKGNLPLFLLWIGIVWTAAAFGEEMFFRGFLITQCQTILKGAPLASAIAVLLPALFFGWAHMYYQGLRGFVMTGAIAIAFGAMFLILKRNLWPMIIVHGAVDTIGFVARFMDRDM